VVAPVVAAAIFVAFGGTWFGRTTAGSAIEPQPAARLVSFNPFPMMDAETCTWEVATPEAPPALDTTPVQLLAQTDQPGAGGRRAGSICATLDCASPTAQRKPLRFIQDPYHGYSGVAVDPVRDEVVLLDENRFNILVYDRRANTPAAAPRTEPKRVIGGLQTESEYVSGVHIDPSTGDLYVVNNDTVHNLAIFSRNAQGNVEPDGHLTSPYGNFGIAVNDATQELFLTVQHDSAVMVYRKAARGDERPIRLIQGDRTRMGDPHGIVYDAKSNLIFVSNYGTSRQAVQGTLGANGRKDLPRVPNWPAGNLMPYSYRHEVQLGTGRFGPPSITVYDADAHGNVAPVRVIEGPKAQLNWPTAIALDSERGELYVANSVGDSINVFSATAQGDVAPTRVLKGARTLLKNPSGVFVDTVNDEVWVANFGNHMATVYRRTASGDTAPLRVIRSAPVSEPASLFSNPFGVAYDTRREEIIAPNCVGHPRIGIFARTADKNAAPVRWIEGQNTLLNRTVHSVGYDAIHDEIVVNSNSGQAILTFRGGADGNEAPIRIIHGPKTQLRDPEKITLDPVNNEIYVFNMSIRDSVLVFDRMAQGDVAPKRILKGPDTLLGAGAGAVDPVHNLLVVGGGNGLLIFDRTASGNTKPKAVIRGPSTGLGGGGLMTIYPETGRILTTVMGRGAGGESSQASDEAFMGVWSINDNGDIPPRWTIGGPKGMLRRPHGVVVDAKNKTVIITDKYQNGVLTYSFPEMFEPDRSRQTARADSR
jgi:DNA-binding beta-propeller fold protein YncE